MKSHPTYAPASPRVDQFEELALDLSVTVRGKDLDPVRLNR